MTDEMIQENAKAFSNKELSLEDRENKNGHKGVIIWLTGLSASGKSTIALGLEHTLYQNDIKSFMLDGDKVRQGLCSDLGFSAEDRTENIRRVGEVAKLFQIAGSVVIVAFISPYNADRNLARKKVKEGRFVEAFVDCPIEVCEKRDPKGLYVKARKGEVAEFTGISAPYENPENPEIHLKTNESNVNQCVDQIISYLRENKLIEIAK